MQKKQLIILGDRRLISRILDFPRQVKALYLKGTRRPAGRKKKSPRDDPMSIPEPVVTTRSISTYMGDISVCRNDQV